MARPQLLFLARQGELVVFDLTKRPARRGDARNGDNRLLRIVETVGEVQEKLAKYRREQVESGLLFADARFGSDDRADRALIRDLGEVRKALIADGLSPGHTHALIGRSIFIRYLEDRKVLTEKYFRQIANRVDKDKWGKVEAAVVPLLRPVTSTGVSRSTLNAPIAQLSGEITSPALNASAARNRARIIVSCGKRKIARQSRGQGESGAARPNKVSTQQQRQLLQIGLHRPFRASMRCNRQHPHMSGCCAGCRHPGETGVGAAHIRHQARVGGAQVQAPSKPQRTCQTVPTAGAGMSTRVQRLITIAFLKKDELVSPEPSDKVSSAECMKGQQRRPLSQTAAASSLGRWQFTDPLQRPLKNSATLHSTPANQISERSAA